MRLIVCTGVLSSKIEQKFFHKVAAQLKTHTLLCCFESDIVEKSEVCKLMKMETRQMQQQKRRKRAFEMLVKATDNMMADRDMLHGVPYGRPSQAQYEAMSIPRRKFYYHHFPNYDPVPEYKCVLCKRPFTSKAGCTRHSLKCA